MKVLFTVACALAVASAGYSYHGPEHHPIIHKGVPVDTPEVQHARAAHLAALEKASAHGGYHHDEYQHNDHHHNDHHVEHHGHSENYGYSIKHVSHHHHKAPVDHAPIKHHAAPAYHTSHVLPAIGHDGRPLDTPEVEAAKAYHFAAVHKALSEAPSHNDDYHFRQRRSVHAIHIPVIDKHGVPVEPLEVQHARAEHLAHHAAAHHSGYEHHEDYSHEDQNNDSHEDQNNDSHEDQDDYSQEDQNDYSHEHQDSYSHDEIYSHPHAHKGHADLHEGKHGYTLHQKHAPVYGHHDAHQFFVPKYDYHGLPLDTKEVEHLKAKHFAAHAKALHHY